MQTMWCFLLLSILLAVPSHQAMSSVELNEYSFDKIIDKFEAVLVKFDVGFPYGDKHDAYIALAKDAIEFDEFLVAEVNVKDYGEKDNEALARKFGATKENFPIVKLFVKGKTDPLPFNDAKGFTSNNLRKFVKENAGIQLSLPGCVRELDELAAEFLKTAKDERNNVLKKIGKISLSEKKKPSIKVYKTIMEKIMEKGEGFVATEIERVNKLLNGKLSEEKIKEINNRLNILQTFNYIINEKEKKKLPDEL